jgi:hypothetical protein
VSFWLKLAALLAVALAFANAQCLAQCSLAHCQSEIDQAGTPPCHQHHHKQAAHSCAQLASLDYAASVAHAPALLINGLPTPAAPLPVRRRAATSDPDARLRLAPRSPVPLRI